MTTKRTKKSSKHRISRYTKKKLTRFIVCAVLALVVFCGIYIFDNKTYVISDLFLDFWYGTIHPLEKPPVSELEKPDHIETLPEGISQGEMRIHFIDVGQGDCILLELPDGKKMIVDGGPRSKKRIVLSYLDSLHIQKLDYLILTHTDEDHVGSLDDVINHVEVNKMYVPDVALNQINTNVYKDFLAAMSSELKIVPNSKKDYSTRDDDFAGENGYSIDFITPTADFYHTVNLNTAEGKNSVSPIIMVTFGGRKVLLTGDANFQSEKQYLAEVNTNIHDKNYYDVDVLKVGHHGSATSTGSDFLEIIKPEYAIISYGEGNKYGHPAPSLLTRLAQAQIETSHIYDTAKNSHIVLSISQNKNDSLFSMTFTTAKTKQIKSNSSQSTATHSTYLLTIANIRQDHLIALLFVGIKKQQEIFVA